MIVTHMAIEACVIDELAATARAGARIHHLVACRPWLCKLVQREVIDAVVEFLARERLPQKGYAGIVRVQDERRAIRELTNGRAPERGHAINLTVAVELIAKEISEDHDARWKLLDESRKGGFVDLQHGDGASGTSQMAVGERANDK